MFWLIRALLVHYSNQSRSWLLVHYKQSIKILTIHTLVFWLIRALLVTINNQSRSWSSIHRCSDRSGPYLSLSTINQDLDYPYTDVLSDQGLNCHYQQSMKILIIHTQMFCLIMALLVTINNQSRSWSSIHRCSDWSVPYLSLSTINQDLDHPYSDILTDQGLTCHYQQSIKILIIHTQMFWLIRALLVIINNQSISWSSIHRWSDWSEPYLSLSTINENLDHPYTDVLTDQGFTCHFHQSMEILIIHTQVFWLIRVHLSLSTINQDLDHSYTDVLTDQCLTCHF